MENKGDFCYSIKKITEKKKGVFRMYILAILAIILSVCMMSSSSSWGVAGILNYVDLFSLVFILIIVIPVLLSAGLFRDFNRAFAITLGHKKVESLLVLKRAKEAVELARKAVLYSGVFVGIFSTVIVLNQVTDFSVLGANMSVAWLSALYGVALSILLLPISTRLEIKIAEYMHKE